jgi:hypothetical protein
MWSSIQFQLAGLIPCGTRCRSASSDIKPHKATIHRTTASGTRLYIVSRGTGSWSTKQCWPHLIGQVIHRHEADIGAPNTTLGLSTNCR